MGYKEEYEKAKGKGKTKTLTSQIHSWDEEGEELVGKVIDVKPFKEGKFDTEVDCYWLETDEGIVTTVLGSATDKQLKEVDPIGQNIHITYKGKKMLADGRSVNNFHVEVF